MNFALTSQSIRKGMTRLAYVSIWNRNPPLCACAKKKSYEAQGGESVIMMRNYYHDYFFSHCLHNEYIKLLGFEKEFLTIN